LIDQYGLRGKDVLEIGCGKGEFITLLSELGDNRGVGFDPGYREDRNLSEAAKNVKFIKDFYSEKYSGYQADFVCCKMTLEHIPDTAAFIGTVRRSIGDRKDTIVFFQIPEVTRILSDCAFEDIYYEHCSYFSPGSLARLFRSRGFDVLAVKKEYGDQYLTIEARPGTDNEGQTKLAEEDDLEALTRSVATFPARCEERLGEWRGRLADFARGGKRVVLWGSGSKGVSFLTTLNAGNAIEYVVDINPHRQGYFMSGTGQKIVSPGFLRTYKPDVVIVMNAIYCDEIRRDLEQMRLAPELLSV
jgi:SAM-dependent methyltransferase